jgi:acetyl esterase/lipase
VIRLGNVSRPTITVFSAPADVATGAAVMVCPGGGYNILAMDLEGTEVCEWLNSIGVTAVLLKYRVPAREGMPRHAAALQDAQRAMGLIRQRAGEWGIDPERVGCLGFSAGGHLCAVLAAGSGARTYEAVDDADKLSCRPNFMALIYAAYLTQKDNGDAVSAETAVTKDTAPTFLAMTEDDPVRAETALFYYLALKNAKVPAELHLYPMGGHGYGLRRSPFNVSTWPQRAAEWLKSLGALERKN